MFVSLFFQCFFHFSLAIHSVILTINNNNRQISSSLAESMLLPVHVLPALEVSLLPTNVLGSCTVRCLKQGCLI